MDSFQFGKYAGKSIRDPSIPLEHLEKVASFKERDAAALRTEIERRESLMEANASYAERVLKLAKTHAAKKWHPDAGGSAEEFREAMKAIRWLEECVRQAQTAPQGQGASTV